MKVLILMAIGSLLCIGFYALSYYFAVRTSNTKQNPDPNMSLGPGPVGKYKRATPCALACCAPQGLPGKCKKK